MLAGLTLSLGLAVGRQFLLDPLFLLGGDHAWFQLASRPLPAATTHAAFGVTVGDSALRDSIAFFALLDLEYPFLQFVGGLYLLWNLAFS